MNKSDYFYLLWKFKREKKRNPTKKELNELAKTMLNKEISKKRFEGLLDGLWKLQ